MGEHANHILALALGEQPMEMQVQSFILLVLLVVTGSQLPQASLKLTL